MNKSVSFHGKPEIVWVTPNFWTVAYTGGKHSGALEQRLNKTGKDRG